MPILRIKNKPGSDGKLRCLYCYKSIERPRDYQDFCPTPATCRSQWHVRARRALRESGLMLMGKALREHASTDGWTRVRISSVLADQDELDRLRTENAKLRVVLEVISESREKCVFSEDEMFRLGSNAAFGQIADIADAALSPQSATPTPNPPEAPAERATGHESAGIEVGE